MFFSGLKAHEKAGDPEQDLSRSQRPRRRFFLGGRSRGSRGSTDHPKDTLKALRDRLGLTEIGPAEDSAEDHESAPIMAFPADEKARALAYAPDIDGQVEAGEIAWLWVPAYGPDKPPAERAMVVVGRANREDVLGLLISPEQCHDEEHNWLAIGPGGWNPSGETCWVRADKVIQVPEHSVRRQGVLLPEARFDRIARVLRSRFGWM